MPKYFFDDYPHFYRDQSDIVKRLNVRHHAIIESNQKIIENKNILDIASNDGRWSFAAIKAGAAHVIGIEGRYDFYQMARKNFHDLGVDIDKHQFLQGDVFDRLKAVNAERCDTVFCLGFLYHTLRFDELFTQIKLLKPKHLIIDTKVSTSSECIVDIIIEETTPMNALEDTVLNRTKVAVGFPSVSALVTMLKNYNFVDQQFFPWPEYLAEEPDTESIHQLKIYNNGSRVTVVCRNADVD